MSEKYLLQKITNMPEMADTYRNHTHQFETESLDEIIRQFVDFLQSSGFTYVEGLEVIYDDE